MPRSRRSMLAIVLASLTARAAPAAPETNFRIGLQTYLREALPEDYPARDARAAELADLAAGGGVTSVSRLREAHSFLVRILPGTTAEVREKAAALAARLAACDHSGPTDLETIFGFYADRLPGTTAAARMRAAELAVEVAASGPGSADDVRALHDEYFALATGTTAERQLAAAERSARAAGERARKRHEDERLKRALEEALENDRRKHPSVRPTTR